MWDRLSLLAGALEHDSIVSAPVFPAVHHTAACATFKKLQPSHKELLCLLCTHWGHPVCLLGYQSHPGATGTCRDAKSPRAGLPALPEAIPSEQPWVKGGHRDTLRL